MSLNPKIVPAHRPRPPPGPRSSSGHTPQPETQLGIDNRGPASVFRKLGEKSGLGFTGAGQARASHKIRGFVQNFTPACRKAQAHNAGVNPRADRLGQPAKASKAADLENRARLSGLGSLGSPDRDRFQNGLMASVSKSGGRNRMILGRNSIPARPRSTKSWRRSAGCGR